MRELELSSGAIVRIKYSIIDMDGTNLEEGVDIFIGDKYLGSLLGLSPEEVTEDDIFNLEYEKA